VERSNANSRARPAGATLLVLALFAATPAAASAQSQAPVDASRDEEARMLFHAGVEAFSAGRYPDALSRFEAAYELSPRPDLLYNLGSAADRMRRDEVALDYFERYLAARPESARRTEVLARIEALRRAIAERASRAEAIVVAPPLAPAAAAATQDHGENVLETWWLWTIVGVVVVGAGVGIGVGIAMNSGPEPPRPGDVGPVVFALERW
jgi:tetratricopeptide (TPR) repeat protein